MQIGPILQRELRVCLRRPEARRFRNQHAYWATGFSALLLVVEGFGVPILQYLGFWIFASSAMLAGALPLWQCLGLIQDERHARTFPLLRLAGVGPLQFFAGKALSALWSCGFPVLGCLPVMALPFLSGGLAYHTFLGMLAFLPAVLVASVGVTLFTSTVCRDEAGARVLLSGIVLTWCLGTPLLHALGRMATGVAPFGPEVLWISPFYAGSLLQGDLTRSVQGEFWRAIALMWGVGVTGLLGAAVWLGRTWTQDELAKETRSRSRITFAEADPLRGDAAWNPLADWVAGETARLRWPYFGLALFAGLWLVASAVWGRAWMGSLMGLLLILTLALFGAGLPSFLLSARVARDRRTGALEELLSTRLSPGQIVEGHVAGVQRLVRPFQIAVASVAGVIWLAGLLTRSWEPPALLSYAILGGMLEFWVLARGKRMLYQSFRLAFVTGQATAGLRRGGSAIAMGNAYNLFNFYRLIQSITTVGKLPEFPTGAFWEVSLVLAAAGIGTALWHGFKTGVIPARRLAEEEMRILIQEPVPDKADPRFKTWDANTPWPAATT